jgi:hypothetical protein
MSKTYLRVCFHEILTQITVLTLECYYMLFSTKDGNQNLHMRNLDDHAGRFIYQIACPTYDVRQRCFGESVLLLLSRV